MKKDSTCKACNITLYVNSGGKCPVSEFVHGLNIKQDKQSRKVLLKIRDATKFLEIFFNTLGSSQLKYLGDGIWELTPINNVVVLLFFYDNEIVLLDAFNTDTNKTPLEALERAKAYKADFISRH